MTMIVSKYKYTVILMSRIVIFYLQSCMLIVPCIVLYVIVIVCTLHTMHTCYNITVTKY